jgi:hypothetical protein
MVWAVRVVTFDQESSALPVLLARSLVGMENWRRSSVK